jgi:hypothetical protein
VLSIINGGGKWVELSIEADPIYQTILNGAERRFGTPFGKGPDRTLDPEKAMVGTVYKTNRIKPGFPGLVRRRLQTVANRRTAWLRAGLQPKFPAQGSQWQRKAKSNAMRT